MTAQRKPLLNLTDQGYRAGGFKLQTNLVFLRSKVVGEPRAFLEEPRNAGI